MLKRVVLLFVTCLVGVSFKPLAEGSVLKPVATVPLPCDSMQQMISPAGDQAAVQCRDHTLRLVNVGSGATQHTFEAEPKIESYNYSPDGRWFAIGRWDGTVEVAPTSGTAEPKRWKTAPRVEVIEFFPDSAGVIVGTIDGAGQVWDLRGAPKQVANLQEDFGGMTACAFSPDGQWLVTADGDTIVRFYDTASWRILHDYRGVKLETFSVAFASAKRILIGGADDKITELDDTATEKRRIDKDLGVVAKMLPIGSSGQAAILYFDGEGKAPPHQSIWNIETGVSSPLPSTRPLTGGGVVHGKLWVASAKGKALEIWEYD